MAIRAERRWLAANRRRLRDLELRLEELERRVDAYESAVRGGAAFTLGALGEPEVGAVERR
jgi:hypothetical protein